MVSDIFSKDKLFCLKTSLPFLNSTKEVFSGLPVTEYKKMTPILGPMPTALLDIHGRCYKVIKKKVIEIKQIVLRACVRV